ncbi:6-phosphogluconate dehydrogenase/gluconokinase [Flavobacteriaceae bacterium MAR_2010_188]|nr:6-phosphogluconate dehydrogenase/gluconokinase [Flavobacteriaceae bacterium MAR_2010_188]
MGVSGSGKTTIGRLLAERLSMPFYDADDFHSEANIKKMKDGIALNDEDRMPWLYTISKNLKDWQSNKGSVLACSALKESYREIFNENLESIIWVYLDGKFTDIDQRLKSRGHHYFNPALLHSQFDTLEIPDYGIKVPIDKSPDKIVDSIIKNLNEDEKI